MMNLERHIESILFVSDQPVRLEELLGALQKIDANQSIDEEDVEKALSTLEGKYSSEQYVFEIKKIGGGWQFLSKPMYHNTVSLFLNHKSKKKLSAATLETLSIIAYKQPVTRAEIEKIRGVQSDYTIHKLLEKELISIAGKADTPGKPIIYTVSQYFLDYFGINSTEELPKIKEILPNEENSIGREASEENQD